MDISLDCLRDDLIASREDVMQKSRRATNKYVVDLLSAEVRVIDRILIFLHECEKEGKVEKKKLPLVLSEEAIDFGMIGERRKNNELEENIKLLAERLKELLEADKERKKYKLSAALPIDTEDVNGGYFRTKVHEMVRENKLPGVIRPRQHEGRFYIVRFRDERDALRDGSRTE